MVDGGITVNGSINKSRWFPEVMVSSAILGGGKMIKCKDFAPRITERGPFGGPAEYEPFSEVVSAVNQWLESITIQVINVETVVLPDRLEGTSDRVYGVTVSNGVYPVMVSQGVTINCFQCVRVWYRE